VSLQIKEGTWIAARSTAEDRLLSDEELSRYQDKSDGLGGEYPCRLRFAHTSPIYVTVGGVGAAVPSSIDEARRMLEAFERYAVANASERDQREITDALRVARTKLEFAVRAMRASSEGVR